MQTKEETGLSCMQISERRVPGFGRLPLHPIPLQTAPTVPCAAAIPGCMIPPAIPIISGYFIISGCSHNSDLNGVVCGPPVGAIGKKEKWGHMKCFLTMSHRHYLCDLPQVPNSLFWRLPPGITSPWGRHKPWDGRWNHSRGVPSNPPLVAH